MNWKTSLVMDKQGDLQGGDPKTPGRDAETVECVLDKYCRLAVAVSILFSMIIMFLMAAAGIASLLIVLTLVFGGLT